MQSIIGCFSSRIALDKVYLDMDSTKIENPKMIWIMYTSPNIHWMLRTCTRSAAAGRGPPDVWTVAAAGGAKASCGCVVTRRPGRGLPIIVPALDALARPPWPWLVALWCSHWFSRGNSSGHMGHLLVGTALRGFISSVFCVGYSRANGSYRKKVQREMCHASSNKALVLSSVQDVYVRCWLVARLDHELKYRSV